MFVFRLKCPQILISEGKYFPLIKTTSDYIISLLFFSGQNQDWNAIENKWDQARFKLKGIIELSDFIKKYLNLCSEDERRSYGFGTT